MIESEFITWNAPKDEHPVRAVCAASYDAVGRKAKDEWLDLFATDAVLEDPVGPSFFDPEGKGHRGRAGISAFWDLAIAPLAGFHATINDSFANGNSCANVGVFTTTLEDGSIADTELVATYVVDDHGKIVSMRAHWEVERTMATVRKPL